MSEIEESLKRITSHSGVMGVAVLDDAGKLARYSLPQELAEKYGEQVWLLQNIARTAVRDVDPQNDLTYFRIDTKRFEILVAPFWGEVKYGIGGAVKDKGYTLFVLQRKPGQS
uniref:Roadblock/LAMTOR2 domain-containing protein n=2 Tax=Hemiselmis TaxID=77924 RepID=A0A7S0Z536_9CRYP|mmetsp:Transcript_29270/g.73590  ORF Transcript_29270/g.73590 Transcript_29270/m.73590 type:complete len:113 (+) Transcript_29270:141-479(+)|eukprot:CAMPEP_0114126672 /NCGR_PEP_ID=MMETSP0043_2-20121206/9954_1 /TAXON_ID=464988 /ORGANISM="Hemiselmis andersenii, Strain CCMP644" /LENGTH=112 /DNA_ID=CAMNT_0001219671 /DNA_START=207 /DNA_END=545 /DNA_ORIENTATION=-